MGLFSKKVKEEKPKEPMKEQLGKELDGIINEANMQGSDILARMMLARLTFGIDSSKNFPNSDDQVDSFLKKYPSMIMFRQQIIDKCKKFRKENGLAE